jgi:hypothetical protein
MGVRAPSADVPHAGAFRPRSRGPGGAATLAVFVVALVLLLANGRSIGDTDASGAAGWLYRLLLSLAGRVLDVDPQGAAVLGKLLAAVCAAGATAALFAAVAIRQALDEARWSAVALALGTTLAAAAQAWSAEAPATFLVAVGLALLVRADSDDEPAAAARAGLPLALAASLQPSVLAPALVLLAAQVVRWPRSGPSILGWTAGGAVAGIVAIAAAGQAGVAGRSPMLQDPEAGVLALLASPAKGALVFAPVAVVGLIGLVQAWRNAGLSRRWDGPRRSRLLPIACGLGVFALVTTVAVQGGWDAPLVWGPRWLAPAWPLLLVFLPEGLAASKLPGLLVVLASIAVQVVGLASYDGRWDRLHRSADGRLGAAAWAVDESPLVFQWKDGVLRPAVTVLDGRRLRVRQMELLAAGDAASLATFRGGAVRLTGADPTFEAVRLQQGARVDGDALLLPAPGDAIAFRVREGSRIRKLELRIAGTRQRHGRRRRRQLLARHALAGAAGRGRVPAAAALQLRRGPRGGGQRCAARGRAFASGVGRAGAAGRTGEGDPSALAAAHPRGAVTPVSPHLSLLRSTW